MTGSVVGATGTGGTSAHTRRPRVAILVYNDCRADTRVLKTASTLARAGADVRIFAVVSSATRGAARVLRLEHGVVLERIPVFDLVTVLAPLVGLYGRLTRTRRGRPRPAPDGPRSAAATTAPGAAPAAGPASPRPVAEPGARPGLADRAVRSRPVKVLLRPLGAVVLQSYWRGARRAVHAWRPDVVHANDGNTLWPARVLGRTLGVPFVYDSHELWMHRNVAGRRPVARLVEQHVERRGIRAAAGVITVSPSIAEHLRATYGLDALPTLVRNIPPAGQSTTDPGVGRLRGLAGLPADTRVIAYGGRITTNRGLEETISALVRLPEDVHLVVLGYGAEAYVRSLVAHAHGLGVAGRLHLVGTVPSHEVSTALADADASVVFVRPTCLSYRWSLPNKLFESIHGGLPVVAADLPDTRRVVEEHGVGEVFASDDPADMARTIARVIENPAPYREAARRAATVLTWEAESVRLLDLYRDALGEVWAGALVDPAAAS